MKLRRHHNNKGDRGNKSGSRFRELLDSFKKHRNIKITKKY